MANGVNVGDIFSRFVISDEGSAQVQRITGNLQRFDGNLAKTGARLTRLGASITALSAPLAIAAGASLKFSSDFEASMTKIVTLVGVADSQVNQWKQSLLDLAPIVGRGPRELADAMFVVTSAGERGANALRVLENAAKASAIGLGDTKDIARTVTAAIQAYGSANLNASQATATLIATVQEGNLEAAELAGTLGRALGPAAKLGITMDQLGAFVATFTRLGVNSAEAVTALTSTMSGILGPTQKSEKALAEFGLSASKLRQEIREKGLTETLIELVKATEGNEEAISNIIPNIRALRGVLGVTGQQAEAFAEIQRNTTAAMRDADSFITQRFQRSIETQAFTWQRFRAQLEATAIRIGDQLAPEMRKLLVVGENLLTHAVLPSVKAFADLPAPIKTTTVAVTGLGVAAGIAAIPLGQLLTVVSLLSGPAGVARLTAVLGPLGLAIGAAGVAFVVTSARTDAAIEAMRRQIDAARDLASELDPKLVRAAVAAGTSIEDIARATGVSEGALKLMASGNDEAAQSLLRMQRELNQLVPVLDITKQEYDALNDAQRRFIDQQRDRSKGLEQGIEALQQMSNEVKDLSRVVINLGTGEIIERNPLFSGSAAQSAVDRLAELRREVAALRPELRREIQAFHEMGLSLHEIAEETGVSERVLALYTRGTKEATKATGDLAKEMDQLRDRIFGLDAVREATKSLQILAAVDLSTLNAAQIRLVQEEADAMTASFHRAGQQVPAALTRITRTLGPSEGLLRMLRDLRPELVRGQVDFQRFGQALPISFVGQLGQRLSDLPLIETRKQLSAWLRVAEAIPLDPLEGINRVTAEQRERVIAAHAAMSSYVGSVRDLSNALGNLAEVSGGALGNIAQLVALMAVGAESAILLRHGLQGVDAQGNKLSGSQRALSLGIGAIQGAASIGQATDVAGRANRAFRGAAVGAQIGMVAGPIGAAVGAAIGAIVGALRNPAFEDVAKRVAFGFGVSISEELARGIADQAKREFGGSRQAAEIFNLANIIREGGGLNADNIEPLMARLRDAFSLFETGEFSSGQLAKVLGENFGTFSAFVQDSTRVASQGFAEILQLAHEFGTTTREMQQFVAQETGTIGQAIDAMVAASDRSSDSFERLGLIAASSFNAALDAGLGLAEAARQLAPGVQSLIALQEELGITSENAALKELTGFSKRAEKYPELVAGAESLNETMLSLSRIGGLNAETLEAMGQQGVATFDALREAGFKEAQSLQLLKGFLENVTQAHIEMGVPIDENVAKLLELADKHDILKGDSRDLASILVDGFGQVTDAVHLLVQALGHEVPAAARRATDAINRIPRNLDVDVAVGGSVGSAKIPALASGGIVRRPTVALVGESGPEAVVPLPDGIQGMAIHQTVQLTVDGRVLAEVVMDEAPGLLERLGVGA